MNVNEIINICPICKFPLIFRGGHISKYTGPFEYSQLFSYKECKKDFWKVWERSKKKLFLFNIFKNKESNEKRVYMLDTNFSEKLECCYKLEEKTI